MPASFVSIDDRAWRKLLAQAHGLDRLHVRVGVLSSLGGDAVHEDAEGGEITMTELMAIHEFGSEAASIPERKPIRGTFEAKAGELSSMCAKLARAVVTNGMDPRQAYGLLGEWGKSAVRKHVTVDKAVQPPDQPATIVAKNRRAGKPDDAETTTLVDTGRLMNAVDYQVVEGDTTENIDSAPSDPPGSSRDRLGRLRDAAGKFVKR